MLFGRLRPGVTIDQAKSDLNTIAAALEEEFPRANRSQRVEIQLLGKLPATARLPVAVFTGLLFAATGALLLIACVNVAGLLLARLSGRRDELAVRMAVGCGHWRLTRQLLTETVLLFSAAGLIGLVFAFSFERLLQAFQPPAPCPLHLNGSWDYPVFVFTLLLSLVCGLLFGVFPARFATREALGTLLREQSAGSRKLSRLRNVFVAAQVSLCLLLLFTAGLFLRSLQQTARIDLGFDPENVWTGHIDLSLNRFSDSRAQQFFKSLVERTRARPGIQSAAFAVDLPLDGSKMGLGGIAAANQESFKGASFNLVSHGFFETLKIPLPAGRSFSQSDSAVAPPVAIVNQAAAELLWPAKDSLGRRIFVGETGSNRSYSIVGVTSLGKLNSLSGPEEPHVCLPLSQVPRSAAYLVVRSATNPIPIVREVLAELDSNVPLVQSARLIEINELVTLPQRLAGTVFGVVGLAGLILAAIGVFALASFAAVSRTREFGVRLALGARPPEILRLVTRQGLAPAGVGALIGVLLSVAAGQLLRDFLIGISPVDMVAFVGTTALLLGVVLIAALVPALRASRLDPMKALRC